MSRESDRHTDYETIDEAHNEIRRLLDDNERLRTLLERVLDPSAPPPMLEIEKELGTQRDH